MNVLIISPYFLPYTGVGVLRPSSLVQFLIRNGEQVTVFTLEPVAYDPQLTAGTRPSGAAYAEFPMGKTESETAGYFRSALNHLLEKHSFDCCLISCGPFYTIQPALETAAKFGVPVVIDYRDLWLYNTNPSTSLRAFLGQRYYRLRYRSLEASFMKECAAFISCTPGLVSLMERRYPALKGKTTCVYNGYGRPVPEAWPQPAPYEREIRLFVLGKFAYYAKKRAETFLRASKGMLDQGYPLRIVHAGAPEPLGALLEKTGFPKDRFDELGPLSYEDALVAAQAAQIAVIISGGKYGLSTKLFDYIYLNKPVIILGDSGSEMEKMLSGQCNAFFCQSSHQVRRALETFIRKKIYVLTENKAFCAKFSRESQNTKFYQVLRQTAAHREYEPYEQ